MARQINSLQVLYQLSTFFMVSCEYSIQWLSPVIAIMLPRACAREPLNKLYISQLCYFARKSDTSEILFESVKEKNNLV